MSSYSVTPEKLDYKPERRIINNVACRGASPESTVLSFDGEKHGQHDIKPGLDELYGYSVSAVATARHKTADSAQ